MSVPLVSDFLKEIHTVIEHNISTNISTIAHTISPVFFAAVGLYIVYIAYEIIATQRETIMSDVIKNIATFSLIGAFTYSSPYYTTYVVPFVMDAGNDISAAILGGSDAATNVDNMWNGLITALEAFRDKGLKGKGITDIPVILQVYVTYGIGLVGGIILMFFITVYLAVSMFMIGLLLSAGIIFICFSAFPSTRSMFTSWTSNCLNYIMLNVFYSIAFSFVLGIIDKKAKDINPDTLSIMDAVFLLLVILISVFVIEQIGTMTSSLTGGVGINGLTASAGSLISKTTGVAGKVIGQSAKAIRSGSRSAATKLKTKHGNNIKAG